MSRNKPAYVIPYVWRKNGKKEQGAALFSAGRLKGFIPYRELIPISNRLVDIREEYDREESNS